MADISITYETLFEVLRRERQREELSELSPTFYNDVQTYLREKKTLLPGAPDRKKAEMQFENAARLAREIYEKREKKIIAMALAKSRTGTDILNTSVLLDAEKTLYDELIGVLSRHRNARIKSLTDTSGTQPVPTKEAAPPAPAILRVRFLQPVPKFVGRELETYGPFDENEEADLPIEIANILVGKGRAEALDISAKE